MNRQIEDFAWPNVISGYTLENLIHEGKNY